MHEETQNIHRLEKPEHSCLNERIYSDQFLTDENELSNGSLLLSGDIKNLGTWLEKAKTWLSLDSKNVIHLVLPKG